jgi:signal transduction histidine kinase
MEPPFGVISGGLKNKRACETIDDSKDQAEFYIDLLSHDINNMNQVAMGYLELAIEKVKDGKYDPVLFARSMAMIKNSSDLIENVRRVRKIKDEGSQQEILDLGNVLSDVVSQYSAVPGRDVIINYRSATGRMVMASPLLRDVFTNLVNNSIKHSKGPVTLDLDVTNAVNNFYMVVVADNGPGITDEMKTNIFDRFTGGYIVKGTGLGLYLVKTLVESFNGSVWVEDRVPGDFSKGCKFIVMLPAV